MTNVVLIGNFVVPYTTEAYLARALRENGCRVGEVQQDDAYRLGPDAFVDKVLNDEVPTDLVLYTRTHNITALRSDWHYVWERLKAAGVITASVHLDRYWDLTREHLIWDPDPLFTVQHVFTADGGNDDRWAAAGINHHWLPPAVDRMEAEEMPGVPAEGVPEIVFTGSGVGYHYQYPERVALLDHLHTTYGRRFGHYGHGGNRSVVRMQALNDVYATAKVVVGDSCFANGTGNRQANGRYWSDRIPETLGRRGVLLHPWVNGLREEYGADVACYAPGDWNELDARIGELLANPGERDRLREVGQARVLGAHTYTHRMRTLLATVGLPVGADA